MSIEHAPQRQKGGGNTANIVVGVDPNVAAGERLVRMRELCSLTGLGRSTIYRLIKEGRFPKPIDLLGPTTSAWLASEVNAWIAERIAASRGKAAA